MAQIDKPNLHFATTLYTGNGSTNRAVTVGFQPDWIWCKERSQTESHMLHDVHMNAGDYIRMPKSIFVSADKIDAIFNEWENHAPVPYDKFNESMVDGRNGTVFYTLRPDLSYNPQVKSWKYLRQSKWNIRQGGQSKAESIFKMANEIRNELGSTEHFVCMVSNTGGPFNEYIFVSGHDTLSEALDQSAFFALLGELSKRMPDWESTWGQSAWNGLSQVSVHRPDLSN